MFEGRPARTKSIILACYYTKSLAPAFTQLLALLRISAKAIAGVAYLILKTLALRLFHFPQATSIVSDAICPYNDIDYLAQSHTTMI